MEGTSARSRSGWPVTLVVALLGVSGIVVALDGRDDPAPAAATAPVSAEVDLASLPESSTHTVIKAAPRDPRPDRTPKGTVVHPRETVALYDEPDGTAFAKIGPKQFGDTWLPVITRNRDWVQVLLPSKPNGSTAWIQGSKLTEARSRHLVRVHLTSRTLELFKDGERIGDWKVAVGAPSTPTPTGRTFVLGQIIDDKQPFSPVILPLGTHSDTLDSYGGGPGTVALHGWTNPSVFGRAVSHGCVRVPDQALEVLRTVPTGTPVMVDKA